MHTTDGGFTWVVGLMPNAASLPQQKFDDLVATRCLEASMAAKKWRADRLAQERELNDAA